MELYACVGDLPAGAALATTLTDANGNYSFTGLLPGDYIVKFIAADGSVLSTANQGVDDAADSDAGAGGFTGCYELSPGEYDDTPMRASTRRPAWATTCGWTATTTASRTMATRA